MNQPVEPQDPSEFKEGTDTALIVESMTGVMSEIENRLRRRRHKIGMLGRVKKGYWCGSPAPYGYRYEAGDRILTIDPEEAEVVRLIFRLCHEGKSNRQIARHLNLLGVPTPGKSEAWRASTIHLMVRRSTYAGYNPYGDQLFEGKHEAIIERTFWQRVQDQISRRASLKGRLVASEKLFIGLARCGHCGGAMAAIRDFYKDRVYISYYCARHKDTGGASCRPNYKSERKIARAVFETLTKYASDPQVFGEVVKARETQNQQEIQRQRQAALEELSKIEGRKERQFLAYEKGEITLGGYADHRSRLESEVARLEMIVTESETRLRQGLVFLNLEVALRELVERWQELDRQFLKERFRELFDHILIYEDGAIEIIWCQ